ncbi:hypothetical protein GF325_02325, partial [Candidatus Bathyarchaeota archaeon]|nr:hypothetical protein [Candidatus Bathyarchaeota archaeon]
MVSLPELIKSNNIARFKLDKRGTGWDGRMRLLLLSDTHISRTSDRFSVDILKKGINQVNQLKNVDFVLHLGDITDNGTKSDYLYANELFDLLDPTLKENMFFIPGNHDVKNVGDRLYEEYITPKRSFTIELPNDSVIIGLDSTEPDQDQGEIGFRTTKLFKQIIEQYSGLKIVCFHHQLVPIPKTGRERSAVNDAGNVLKMLLETNVNLVLNGHRHITNLYNLSDGEGELMIFNAGTMSCLKTRFHQLWTYTLID